MHAPEHTIFPQVGGTEEEFRGSYTIHSPERVTESLEPVVHTILDHISTYCPPIDKRKQFRSNGGRIYEDGGIEAATPECDSPLQQTAYIRANSEIVLAGIKDFIRNKSVIKGYPISARLQRRTIDSTTKSWGCHDNLSFLNPQFANTLEYPHQKLAWTRYLETRGIISGAGYVNNGGVYFSQKMSKNNRFTAGTHQRTPILLMHDYRQGVGRLEIRCSDVNLKEWACIARLGNAALFQAASQTGLLSKMARSQYYAITGTGTVLNMMPLDEKGNLQDTSQLQKIIDLQEYTFDTILNELESQAGEPIPADLQVIGERTLDYLKDLRRVSRGEAGVELLTARSDWAQKLHVIQANLHRHTGSSPTDIAAQTIDLAYDTIGVTAERNGSVVEKRGYGYIQADKHRLTSAEDVSLAMQQPPASTRSAQRVAGASHAKAQGAVDVDVKWDQVSYTLPGQVGVKVKKLNKLLPVTEPAAA